LKKIYEIQTFFPHLFIKPKHHKYHRCTDKAVLGLLGLGFLNLFVYRCSPSHNLFCKN